MEKNELENESIASNINREPIHVQHKELERYDESSDYRSLCPVCEEGILLVRRDQSTYQLIEQDNCLLCGQAFIYDDIDEFKKLGETIGTKKDKKDYSICPECKEINSKYDTYDGGYCIMCISKYGELKEKTRWIPVKEKIPEDIEEMIDVFVKITLRSGKKKSIRICDTTWDVTKIYPNSYKFTHWRHIILPEED